MPAFLMEDDRTSLQGFLELATLANETDNLDASQGSVTLMTLHASKGWSFRRSISSGLKVA
jgi:superfamily I DNA/RNA helicase